MGYRLGFGGRIEDRRRMQPRRRFRGPPIAEKLSQVKQDGSSIAVNKMENFEQKKIDHEAILDNFDSFIKLAGTELLQLKDVAKNISASKGEVDLWQIISSVNSTVRQNPTSNMAKLMRKFEERYMSDDDNVEDTRPADAVYERSLSSLLFLSMGIFLLNSVNDLVDSGGINIGSAEPRSLDGGSSLDLLANTLNHKEILQLFNYTSFDFFDHSDPESVDA